MKATRITGATLLALLPVMALRWVSPVARTLAFGFPDLSTALFLVPLVLGVIGLPGYVQAVASKMGLSPTNRRSFWLIASILSELNAAFATIVLWVISSHPILSTLGPYDWLEWLTSPIALAVVCVWLRR